MFEIVLITIGAILVLLGVAGSVLPILPGPPLSFAGFFLLAFMKEFVSPLTPTLVVVMGVFALGVSLMDYALPLLGAKRYGASKWGIWGAVGGMVIGIFFSPFGMVLGALVGAVVVEWLVQRRTGDALRAGWGVVISSLLGMVLKLAVCLVMAYYFVRALV